MLTKMKLAIVVCGSLICGVAAAQSADHEAIKAKRAEMKEKMLAKFDTNKDGKLDKAEREVMHDALAAEAFKRLDTNNDGQLSLAEFKAGKKHFGMRHARRGFGDKPDSR